MTPLYLARLFIVFAVFIGACSPSPKQFHPGNISSSTTFKKVIHIPGPGDIQLDSALLYISGNDLVLDFNGLIIDARSLHNGPDEFKGIALHISNSQNIEIRNLTVRGMRYAVLAENVDSLKIINCDFSYNYRPRLYSKWDRESLSDWLYYHNNENDEWKRYAGAMYLKNCDNALIKDVRAEQGFNALMMDRCNNSLIYNNNFRFNSGLGIGMYRSSNNRVMHNRLDFNVRGYSHGQYDRGQDSAGILLYEQCNNNTIAYNSATHSGDGLFLWAGQQTMDTGEGGCNGNIIYKNDFSHSVANGVEATFSSNVIIENKLNDCRYGIWAGYSHHTLIEGNEIRDCDHGIAIEHGNTNVIRKNIFTNSASGIELWERTSQPAEWGFAAERDISSRGYVIEENAFENIERAIHLTSTDSVYLQQNIYNEVIDDIVTKLSQEPQQTKGDIQLFANIELPLPLPDGMETTLESQYPRGRKNILVNMWGPYNFSYPDIFLRRVYNDESSSFDHTFAFFGPTGNWKLLPGARGVNVFRPKSGTTPSTIELKASPDSSLLQFNLEYLGPDYINQFGDSIGKGAAPLISFSSYSPSIDWQIEYYNYADISILEKPFQFISDTPPTSRISAGEISLIHWHAPAPHINPDMFLTHANGKGNFEKGEYSITLESDDGVILLIDGERVIDNWIPHSPEIDRAKVRLDGSHNFEIVHFDAAGLSALDFRILPKPIERDSDFAN